MSSLGKFLSKHACARVASALAFAMLAAVGTGPALGGNFAVCNASSTVTCGADPNPIFASFHAFTIGKDGNGPLNPFLLFVAIPNIDATPELAPTIASTGNTIALATSPRYGQTGTPVSGYLGELSAGDEIYGMAGLTGNNSMNWSNLSGLDPGVLSFSVYEFVATIGATPVGNNLGNGNDYVFSYTNLAAGSYIAAWGEDPQTHHTFVYDSPFTTSGRTTGDCCLHDVPEPQPVALLGLGLFALIAIRRKFNS